MHYMPKLGVLGVEGEKALILRSQGQMISAAQAHALGMSRGEIRWKVKSGQWQHVYRGVYAAFSGELTRAARLWAVILRMGDDAALSHETAAEYWGFGKGAKDGDEKIHVIVPATSNPTRKTDSRNWPELRRVVVHLSRNWAGYDVELLDLPYTPIAQTILDLVESAATLDDAYAWVSRALTRNKATRTMIMNALSETKRMTRRQWLQDALADVSDGVHFPLERRWVRDVEQAHGLPTPSRQVKRDGADGIRYLDNFYVEYGLVVELDGAAFHPSEDLDKDRRRDNETKIARSADTLRYGFKEVANRPCEQAEQFARALIAHGWPADTLKPCRPACPVIAVIERLAK